MEYVLTKVEDGTEYMRIRAGVPFRIDNQMRNWYPTLEEGRNGKPIMICWKGDEYFYLPEGKIGLWATSSGSARRGVFHRYTPPKNAIEVAVEHNGGRSVLHCVESIDQKLEIGGRCCSHVTHPWWYTARTDGASEQLTYPSIVEEHSNQYHVGCYDSSWTERFTGGTYLVHAYYGSYMNGARYCQILGVWYTPEADKDKVAEAINRVVADV